MLYVSDIIQPLGDVTDLVHYTDQWQTFVNKVIYNDERYQLDATIVIYYHKYLYMFRASICPSSGIQVVRCV